MLKTVEEVQSRLFLALAYEDDSKSCTSLYVLREAQRDNPRATENLGVPRE